jgi:AcrR family transcriptional regulator
VRTVAPKISEAASRKALRWQEHKERTRRDLLASARKLFAERGYPRLRTR